MMHAETERPPPAPARSIPSSGGSRERQVSSSRQVCLSVQGRHARPSEEVWRVIMPEDLPDVWRWLTCHRGLMAGQPSPDSAVLPRPHAQHLASYSGHVMSGSHPLAGKWSTCHAIIGRGLVNHSQGQSRGPLHVADAARRDRAVPPRPHTQHLPAGFMLSKIQGAWSGRAVAWVPGGCQHDPHASPEESEQSPRARSLNLEHTSGVRSGQPRTRVGGQLGQLLGPVRSGSRCR